MENKSNMYTAQTLANENASLAMRLGLVCQERDELKEANVILKKQLAKKEGVDHDTTQSDANNGQTDEQPAEAAPAAK